MGDATYYTVYMSSFLLLARDTGVFLVFCIHKNLKKLNKSRCRVRAIPGMSADWEKNSLKAAPRRRTRGL